MNKPELLAPVGNLDAFYLAIANGADAVYFAGKKFGARAHISNFANEEISEMINYAHRYHVKVYITINTIIKENEFAEVKSFVDFLVTAGVDAIIVQDWGLLYYIRSSYPSLPLHASTQMNVHNLQQAKALYDLGVKRIIFARETPLADIQEIIRAIPLETEVFVHGALCVSYSGNCYFSSFLGKNSGNRGRCHQPCRLPYELVGVSKQAYLLSPKDLMTIDELDKFVACGITSFKIEGRMKRSEYVGLVTKSYRDALAKRDVKDSKKKMSLMFNREFTKGFILNEDNNSFTNVSSPNHIGLTVGRVVAYQNNYIDVLLNDEIATSDALRIVGETEDAIIVNQIDYKGQKINIAQPNMVVRLRVHKQVSVNSKVLKTTDARLIKEINDFKPDSLPLEATLEVENEYLKLTITDGQYNASTLSTTKVEQATSPHISTRIIEQIKKTGQEAYYFKNITSKINNVFLPIKDINQLRRDALVKFTKQREQSVIHIKQQIIPQPLAIKETKKLYFKVSTLAQLNTCLALKVENILVENKNWCSLANDDTIIHYIAPRINNENYKDISNVYENIANAASVYLRHKEGFKTIGLSIELSLKEIGELVEAYKADYAQDPNLMVMVYGYYNLMITKHCLINKAYNLNAKYCGKCYEKQHYLRDRLGVNFPLIDDGDCNLITLNSQRLHLLSYLKSLQEAGITNFIVEFTIEEDIENIIDAYTKAFLGQMTVLKLDNSTVGHIKEGIT